MNTIKAIFTREVVFLVMAVLMCTTNSCRPRSNVETTADTTQTVAELISEADQLYAQRADLMRLRQAIISLRQAVTLDPGSYEASWRLAKCDYYLATHTDDRHERDNAFRDGIEAGKTAVQLEGGKPDG